MKEDKAFAVRGSKNSKTGLVSATYVSQKTCPDDCPFRNAGCYAEKGLMKLHTNRVNSSTKKSDTQKSIALEEASAIDSLKVVEERPLRIHVVGDCKTAQSANIVSKSAIRYQNKGGGKAWSYTHSWKNIPHKRWNGMSIFASVHNREDAIKAFKRGYTPALCEKTFKSEKTWKENIDGETYRFIPCPQQTGKSKNCVSCKLCFDSEKLNKIKAMIVFSEH